MGTATYFSPEQARGAAVDPRSDVYSLGCVLYEMITGRPPFSGENAVAIAYKHVQEQPISPRRVDPALPETLEAIILKCLAKNPANRYPSAQDMQADLRRYLDGARIMAEPVLAPPVDPGATGLMAPTGYMQPTSTIARPSTYGDDGYGDYDGYDDYEDEPPKRSKAFLIALVLLLLVLAGLLFLVARSLGGGGEENTIEVPNVVGQNQEQATAALEDAGLTVRAETVESDRPPGEVIEQDPAANESVEEGAEVTLTVSGGPSTTQVPDVAGMTLQEATQALRDAGFNVTPQNEENDDVEPGQVIRTEPGAGTPLAEGETVTVFVSSGPNTVSVPDVSGRPAAEAEATLRDAGFEVSQTQASSNDIPEGSVISTNPPGGSSVERGTTVQMTVSTGAADVPVPNVEGRTEENARSQLEAAGFQVSVNYEDTFDPSENGRVLSQVPNSGSAPSGSAVQLIVGRLGAGGTTSSTSPFPGGGD
jgi:eukaryotic-like serine/threonine-protein kinase